jgi:uncharacterized protein (TIGR00266 family)
MESPDNLVAIVNRKETGMAMDEIDYGIFGSDMQYIQIELDPGEAAVGEAGAMMFMHEGIAMDTVFGDGSQQGGVFSKLVGAGKRLLTGESIFTTVFENQSKGKRRVAFAAPYPGKIVPVKLAELGGAIICQKDAFLCAAKGVTLGIAFQRRIGVGLFGGEGFIMQKLEGDGMAFMHAGGTVVEKTLKPGQKLLVDTGCIVAFQPGVDFDIKYVGKIKSALFGGEGLFLATLTGPGKIWLQTLPLSRLASRLMAAMPLPAVPQSTSDGLLSMVGTGVGTVLGGIAQLADD